MISELFQNEDGNFIVFPNDAIAQHLKSGKPWEPHFKTVVQHLVKEGDTVLDCGSNFGYNAVIMGKQIGPSGKLFAFEPQRIINHQLCGNMILNNIYNATVFRVALGNEEGLTTMSPVPYDLDWVNIGDTSIGDDGEVVNINTLDNYWYGVDDVSFIKMDVQGYELFTLQGGENTIKKSLPDIFIEIEEHQLAKFDVTKDQLVDYIKSFGYRMFRIDNEYPCDHICTVNSIDKVERLRELLPIVEI
jgi:FkbM family methyltransferase